MHSLINSFHYRHEFVKEEEGFWRVGRMGFFDSEDLGVRCVYFHPRLFLMHVRGCDRCFPFAIPSMLCMWRGMFQAIS